MNSYQYGLAGEVFTLCNKFDQATASFAKLFELDNNPTNTFTSFYMQASYLKNDLTVVKKLANKIIADRKNSDEIEWVLKQRDLTLSISIIIGKKSGMLYAPDQLDMVEKVEEYLDSSVKFKLQKHQQVIFEDESDYAATEVVGDIESLLELANNI